MSEELKPCPLCGGSAVLRYGEDKISAVCSKCGSMIEGKSVELTKALWNSRSVCEREALKICPLCGASANFYRDSPFIGVKCSACGLQTGTLDSKEKVLSLWNKA